MRPAADLFSGGGGWSWGARKSGKLEILFAGNHWEDAIDCHRANFPGARHPRKQRATTFRDTGACTSCLIPFTFSRSPGDQ